MRKNFHENKNSFISDLFFFELEKSKCCKNSCSTNYMLFYKIDDSFKKANRQANILTILDELNMKIVCDKCKKECKSKIKFISFPKILIIVLFSKKENNIKFYYTKKLDFMKYTSEKQKKADLNYNLISLIRKHENGFITFCKIFWR